MEQMSEPSETVRTIMVHDILERSASSALKLQNEDGSFPAGQNTVYNDAETRVRSTAHWLITLSRTYYFTKRQCFFEAASAAADYLLRPEHRPSDHTFLARRSDSKDRCNGLIGQATPIKGLAVSGSILDREELIDVAIDVFEVHPFDEELGLWERIDVDGSNLSFDRTFNHQAAFAARSAPLAKYSKEIDKTINIFLSKLPKNMDIYQNGLIKHYIRPPIVRVISNSITSSKYWKLVWNEMAMFFYLISRKREYKEIGYHPMIIGELGRLNENFPNNSVWDSEIVQSSIDYIKTNEFVSAIKDDGFPYSNMNPGKGIALALCAFDKDVERAKQWLSYDITNGYNFDSDLYELNTPDPVFQSATISSLTDLPNLELSIKQNTI